MYGFKLYTSITIRTLSLLLFLAATTATAQQKLQGVIIRADNAETVTQQLLSQGIRAMTITSTTLTARLPIENVQPAASDSPQASKSPAVPHTLAPGILTDRFPLSTYHYQLENSPLSTYRSPLEVIPSRQLYARMDSARERTGAALLQAGYGLDTPYTGKGVIIGIIDQGFEYRHIAFLDSLGTPRALVVWNRAGYSEGTDSEPTTDIPSNGDGLHDSGHACHVTNIAAGSRVAENNWWGIAPEADLIMIPSELSSAEVLEDVKFISDYAAEQGKPWVINMSFGGTLGPHDGLTIEDQALDEIIAGGRGHEIVVAAGNSGKERIHATHTFRASARDTARLLIDTGYYGAIAEIWCQTTDSNKHLRVKPFLLSDSIISYEDRSYWNNYLIDTVSTVSGKQYALLGMPASALGTSRLGVELTPLDTPDHDIEVHAWTSDNYGTFAIAPDSHFVSGDLDMQIDATFATAENTITVAATVSKTQYVNTAGATVTESNGDVGQVAAFSSAGPALCGALKPTVAAPGSSVCSAVSKYGYGFSSTAGDIVQDVRRKLKHFYYAAYYGTSMATPVVTGTVALWLQANPNLTHEQVTQILEETSTRYDDGSWDNRRGYGDINAYEGLKMALRMADADGIERVWDSRRPVTLLREGSRWKVLFNSDCRLTTITIIDMGGHQVKSLNLGPQTRGAEQTLCFSSLAHGVYMVRIATPGGMVTRKISL